MTTSTQDTVIPWQVLDQVVNILDPKTLAIASCVSKSWYSTMSSDHLWDNLCIANFSTLAHLRQATTPPLSYHRLFGFGQTAKKRREKPSSKPRINLEDLLFIITLNNQNSPPVTLIKPGTSISIVCAPDSKLLFKFDFDVRSHGKWLNFEVMDETKVTWNVVLKGYESVFTMMDCKGKGSFVSGNDGWFSSELPVAGCCCASSCGGSSGMVADMRFVMGGEGRRMVVERVSVGVLCIVSWRYVGVDDGLR